MRNAVPTEENVGYCTQCGRIVVLYPIGCGVTWVGDPGPLEQRWVRSIVGRAAVARHGYGLNANGLHVCGPPRNAVDDFEQGGHLTN